jgi:hypothetical protein
LRRQIPTQTETALKENLITKEEAETLSEFQAKIDRAKMDGLQGDDEDLWVETSPAICRYYVRVGLGKAGYFHYQGVKVCEYGRSEEIKKRDAVQLGELVFGDAHVNQVTSSVPKANTG